MPTVDPAVLRVLREAGDNNLYRVIGTVPSRFRTAAGVGLDTHSVAVAVAGGLLGTFQPRELVDGAWLERLDLSDHGLDFVTATRDGGTLIDVAEVVPR